MKRTGKSRVQDVPLPDLGVDAVFPGDGDSVRLATLELTNPDHLDQLDDLLTDARQRLGMPPPTRKMLEIGERLLRDMSEHTSDDPIENVKGAFHDGGSLLSFWKPSDPDELAEMHDQIKMATRLMAGVPEAYPQLLAAKVIGILGDLERRKFIDPIFQNTLMTYYFGGPIATADVTLADCAVGDPNEPKVLHQGVRSDPPVVRDPLLNDQGESVIEEADRIISGPRAAYYGDATMNHQRIADYWNTYIGHIIEKNEDPTLAPHDIAIMMDLLKTARIVESPSHRDSYVDKIGYAALAHRMAQDGG